MPNLSDKSIQRKVNKLSKELESDMLKMYGTPIISDEQLQKSLGYKTLNAFRQAVLRKTVPITVFSVEKQHGKFALIKDVALHLAQKRYSVIDKRRK